MTDISPQISLGLSTGPNQVLNMPQLVIDVLLRIGWGFIKGFSCISDLVHVIFSLF